MEQNPAFEEKKVHIMRINVDHLIPIALVIGLFLTAIICLACSLSRRELLDCISLFRCCCSRRRRRRGQEDDDDDGNPRTYENLNEFIFEAEDEERAGFVAMNDMETTETSVHDVFPDLLGPAEDPYNKNNNNNRRDVGKSDNSGENNNNVTRNSSSPTTNQLNEPLL